MSKKGANKLKGSTTIDNPPCNEEGSLEEPCQAFGRSKAANKLRVLHNGNALDSVSSPAGKGANKLRTFSVDTVPEEILSAPVPDEFVPPEAGRAPNWQVLIDGFWRCLPCNKIIDQQHVTTEQHKSRLARWQEAQELETCGYKPPDLPYLAYVPHEDGYRFKMCLLCRKSGRPNGTWVTDDDSHTGTHEMPAGSKEHRRNLQNYPPDHPWYVENVTMARLQYHPQDNKVSDEQEAAREVGDPGTTLKRNKLSVKYRPPPDDPDRGAGSQTRTWLEAEPSLPPGWESARDSEGNTYYYHCEDRVPQWQFPTS